MILATLLLTCAAAEEVPPIIRASPHFYGAIGDNRLTVIATASPAEIALGESFLYNVTINNVRDPRNVRRPVLKFDEFTTENLGQWIQDGHIQFLYKLAPRTTGVLTIPGIQFDYYMPEAAEEKRLRTRYTEPITITVKPKPTAVKAIPLRLQSFLDVPDRAEWVPTLMLWIATPIVAAAGVLLYVMRWRSRHPLGTRMARLRRSRDMRIALASLDRGDASSAMRRYLASRFNVPTAGMTPNGVRSALRRHLVDDELATATVSLVRDLDAVRFAGEPIEVSGRVRDTILRLEEALP